MSIVSIVHLNTTADALVPAHLDGSLEGVGVVEVLHRLAAQVDAQLLQLTRLAVLEPEHVQDPDEAVRGVPHGLGEDGQGPRGFLGPGCSHGAGVEAGNLVMDRLIGGHGPG